MAIPGMSDEKLRNILKENLTPSDSIKTPERLFGREKNLTTINRALSSPGRQIFIYGDRGVGKTSLALTAAILHNSADSCPIHVMCGRSSSSSEVVQAIGNASIPVKDRMGHKNSSGGFNFTVAGFGGGVTRGNATPPTIEPPKSLNEALDVIRYVASARPGQTIVIIDELERVEATEDRDKFAEFIKNVPELGDHV